MLHSGHEFLIRMLELRKLRGDRKMSVAVKEEAPSKLASAILPGKLAEQWDKVTMARGLNKSAVIRMIEKYLEETNT